MKLYLLSLKKKKKKKKKKYIFLKNYIFLWEKV